MRGTDITGRFNELIDEALAEEKREVNEAEAASARLRDFVTSVLPLVIGAALILVIAIAVVFARGLTRSVSELQRAATAFGAGNLDHRIPEMREQEFDELGGAFNRMAHELSVHRSEAERPAGNWT